MADQLQRKGISIDIPALEKELRTKVVLMSARNNEGVDDLKSVIANYESLQVHSNFNELAEKIDANYFKKLSLVSDEFTAYEMWMLLTKKNTSLLSDVEKEKIKEFESEEATSEKAST